MKCISQIEKRAHQKWENRNENVKVKSKSLLWFMLFFETSKCFVSYIVVCIWLVEICTWKFDKTGCLCATDMFNRKTTTTTTATKELVHGEGRGKRK